MLLKAFARVIVDWLKLALVWCLISMLGQALLAAIFGPISSFALWSSMWFLDCAMKGAMFSLAMLTLRRHRDNACVLAFVLAMAGVAFAAWGLLGEECNWNMVIFGPLVMGGLGALCAWHWVGLVRRDRAAAEEASQPDV